MTKCYCKQAINVSIIKHGAARHLCVQSG